MAAQFLRTFEFAPFRSAVMIELGEFVRTVRREKCEVVTVAGHYSDDIPQGTLNSMLKQAGLKP